jgi:hypothetical protein
MIRKLNMLFTVILLGTVFISQRATAMDDPPFAPIRIEAEGWSANSGGMYAVTTNDVDGNQHVVGIANGSWMDYSINTGTSGAGNYSVTFRIATPQVNAQFQLKSGNTVLKTISISSTGSWNNWENVTVDNVALASGTQTIRVASVANETCNFNWMEFTLGAPNHSPTANAGSTQSINLPTNQATLTGSGTDDDGTIASYAWTQVSGTAATITSPSAATTTITSLAVTGDRVFRLTVTDDKGATGSAEVTVSVGPDPSPEVNTGGNQTITLPTTQVTLTGTATAQNGGTITSYAWTKISGSATASISSPLMASTSITGLTSAGIWVFRLTATDNQNHTGFSEVTITVQSTGGTANYWSLNSSSDVYYNNGNVGIGTNTPQSLLAVKGEITAKKVRVTQLGWSDYVFEKKYRLPSLREVEEYITKHKHLTEVPSAAEVEKRGIDLGDNQSLLLKKIEELTLYAIDAAKKIEQQQKSINALQEQVRKLQQRSGRNK